MLRKNILRLTAAGLLLAAPLALRAETTEGEVPTGTGHEAESHEEKPYSEVMFHHIVDTHELELPAANSHWGVVYDLHEVFGRWEVTLGGTTLDLTPSRHTLFMWLAALLLILVLLWSRRKYDEKRIPHGSMGFLEAIVLFVRDEIAISNIGKHEGPRYVPFLLTLFFFILFMNLLGLVPYGATATSNLAVTGGLALCAFVVVQLAGMRGQGVVGYWAHLVPAGVPWWLWPIMLPIEILGLFTKPFALMIRLFANMTAGHVVILSLLGLIFIFNSVAVSPISVAFALFIYLLEIFVAFLQAYIFAMLTALFIGLASHPH